MLLATDRDQVAHQIAKGHLFLKNHALSNFIWLIMSDFLSYFSNFCQDENVDIGLLIVCTKFHANQWKFQRGVRFQVLFTKFKMAENLMTESSGSWTHIDCDQWNIRAKFHDLRSNETETCLFKVSIFNCLLRCPFWPITSDSHHGLCCRHLHCHCLTITFIPCITLDS